MCCVKRANVSALKVSLMQRSKYTHSCLAFAMASPWLAIEAFEVSRPANGQLSIVYV